MRNTLFTFLALASLTPAVQAQAPNTTAPAPSTQNGKGGIIRPADKLPVAAYYEGGQDALYTFLAQEVHYPALAYRTRQQGRVLISFILNADGSLANVRVLRNPGGGIGDEAVRLLRLVKFKHPDNPIPLEIPMDFKLNAPSSNVSN